MKRDGLTERQLEVARLVADCYTVKQIAARMGITERSIHRHIDHLVYVWHLDPSKDAMRQIALRVTLLMRPAA